MPMTLTPDEEQAKKDWIIYSTPLWKEAGRNNQWIEQNIETEWITSSQDIIRRYLAGDFAEAVARDKELTLATTTQTVKNYLPWIGLTAAGIILIILLMRRK